MNDTRPDPATVRRQLRAFGEHYDYDTSYLETLLAMAPAAHARFALAQGMSRPAPALAPELHAVASVAVMLADDCGACAQLNLRMAVEAGVDRQLLQSLLDDPALLPPPLDDVFHHAQAVVRGVDSPPDRVTRLRTAIGDEPFGELAVAITGARIYPALKRAIGSTTTCRRPTLDF